MHKCQPLICGCAANSLVSSFYGKTPFSSLMSTFVTYCVTLMAGSQGDTCTSIAMQHIYCECCTITETHALALQCNTYIVNVVQARRHMH